MSSEGQYQPESTGCLNIQAVQAIIAKVRPGLAKQEVEHTVQPEGRIHRAVNGNEHWHLPRKQDVARIGEAASDSFAYYEVATHHLTISYASCRNKVIHKPYVFIRAHPSTGAAVLGVKTAGTVVKVMSRRGDWLQLVNGIASQAGWVNTTLNMLSCRATDNTSTSSCSHIHGTVTHCIAVDRTCTRGWLVGCRFRDGRARMMYVWLSAQIDAT
eukprot:1188054-Prorocentrum_minimum.AAC.1